ncbi:MULTISPECIES: hypothetical protein [Mesorhizobium]|uniref:hypothetical protein n=1 Tax=Mesorhizobium sp. TaxID=1871066 RepID=UPI000AE4823A|nr:MULTISPECIES: hypothetical protein [Mesorhizobium]
MTPTYRGVDGRDGSTRAKTVSGGWIDLHQPRSGLGHATLRSPYPAAQRNIDADTAVFVQHFIRTPKGDSARLSRCRALANSKSRNSIILHPLQSLRLVNHLSSPLSLERQRWRCWPEGRETMSRIPANREIVRCCCSLDLLNLRTRFSRRSWHAILSGAFLHKVIRRRETVLPLAMNWRLLCCCFAVRQSRLILSSNGRHSKADHGRAQERNPKQLHFRLRG